MTHDPIALPEIAPGIGICRVCGRLVERDDEGEWRYVERVEVAS